MILAIEIENSRINFGLFDDNSLLVNHFSIATDINKTSDEYAILINSIFDYYKIDYKTITGAIICSVVPMLTNVIFDLIKQIFADIQIINVQKGIKTGFSIKVDNPAELGADLIANAAAVIEKLKSENAHNVSSIIVDIGTATTIFAINQNKEFIGGSIIPGIEMSFNTLHGKTAQLPNVTLIPPTKSIGKNSQESMRSGVLLGTAIMIDGFVDKFTKEMKTDNIKVFVTGEYSQNVISLCSSTYEYIPNLTLFGFYCIYKKNTIIW